MPVSKAPVIKQLQQGIENLGMCFFDLVKENHRIRPSSNRFGQLPTLLIADVTGRRPDEPRNCMPFLVLGHVDPGHGCLVVEEKFRQCLCEFCFPDTSWAEKQERAYGPVWVLKARPSPPDCI